MQEKDNALSGTPTASNTKNFSTGKKHAKATLTKFYTSAKVTITVTPDALKTLLTLLFFVVFL